MIASSFDAVVGGGGPAGLAAACLLADAGISGALVAGEPRAISDARTVALMTPSIRLLERLGVWPGKLAERCAPLRCLRLVDDTGGFAQAPELLFKADEIGEEAFGWNIPVAALLPALLDKIADTVRVFAASVSAAHHEFDRVTLDLAGETIGAPIVLAADGRNSLLRRSAGIGAREWSYGQVAIATSFAHSAPHRDISTEYHKAAGPFTTVPLPGGRSSLVWMERPERGAGLMSLNDRDFAAEIQIATHGELGLVSDPGPRQLFPMRGLRAMRLAARRVMLIGESGHVIPPLGAQGLNMSLRDAAHAVHLVQAALNAGRDAGSDAVLSRYNDIRKDDVVSRQSAIDFMNRSLLAEFLPLHAARTAGLAALASFGPLRRYVMARGAGLTAELPPIMRPQGISPA
ncbi:UbiH/UbiF family hydroxylase [soil metagenome]